MKRNRTFLNWLLLLMMTVGMTTGEVTIKGNGEATITATVADGPTYTYATKTASYKINVSSQGGLEDYDKKDGTNW